MKILTPAEANPKTAKGLAKGYMTTIMHFAHSKTSGYQVCPWASAKCISGCLDIKGRGNTPTVRNARKARTKFYFEHTEAFEAQLEQELTKFVKKAKRKGFIPAVRLNGTSDLPELAIKFARRFSDIQFYDYTKGLETLLRNDLPANYHLTFSRSETNEKECRVALANGFNVAVIFDDLPETFWGYKVIDGDQDDLRFLDPQGVIVGLTPKGLVAEGFKVEGAFAPSLSPLSLFSPVYAGARVGAV